MIRGRIGNDSGGGLVSVWAASDEDRDTANETMTDPDMPVVVLTQAEHDRLVQGAWAMRSTLIRIAAMAVVAEPGSDMFRAAKDAARVLRDLGHTGSFGPPPPPAPHVVR